MSQSDIIANLKQPQGNFCTQRILFWNEGWELAYIKFILREKGGLVERWHREKTTYQKLLLFQWIKRNNWVLLWSTLQVKLEEFMPFKYKTLQFDKEYARILFIFRRRISFIEYLPRKRCFPLCLVLGFSQREESHYENILIVERIIRYLLTWYVLRASRHFNVTQIIEML